MTQTIREDGPQAHFAKSGTPTMGGVGIFLGIIISIPIRQLIFGNYFVRIRPMFPDKWQDTYFHGHDLSGYMLFFIVILSLFFLLGFWDDYLNLKKSRYLGIRPLYKLLLQVIFAALLSVVSIANILPRDEINYPKFFLFYGFPAIVFYFIFVMCIVVGTVNAVNITDGLDGLAAGCVSLCFVPFLIYSIVQQQWGVAFFILMLLGCTTAFLLFNVHPAKIFMGNCGSMGLGAALAAVAIVLHKEFMLLICGAVFVVETLSVMIQVAYFKSTKKRIFKMAPIHHHFELSGYKETQITRGLWFAGLASCITGAFVFKILEYGF